MLLINCEIGLLATWSADFAISSVTRKTKSAITDTKRYVLVVTLYTKKNRKLQQQLKSDFKRTIINWKKYQSKVSRERQNQ